MDELPSFWGGRDVLPLQAFAIKNEPMSQYFRLTISIIDLVTLIYIPWNAGLANQLDFYIGEIHWQTKKEQAMKERL